jgi:hAT family C-terminal dimerisation region
MFVVAYSLSYMLDPCNLGHGLPALSHHNLENTLFESPEDKVMPSNASQREFLYMQYTKLFIATSQQKNKMLFCYKVLLKGPKIPLEYWLVDGCEWPKLQKIATKLFSMATSSATAEQNFSTMGFIHSKLCNSLSPNTVEKLVFIKSNLAAFYNLLQVVEYESSGSENKNY